MPFGMPNGPSLALELLHASLERSGTASTIHQYEGAFARHIGLDLYIALSGGQPGPEKLAGEWVFAQLAAPWRRPELDARYLDRILIRSDHRLREGLLFAREVATQFVESVAQELASSNAHVVGFSSVFQQTTASVAVARRLKSLKAEAIVVLGGANCEGPMGLHLARAFDCFDYVVSGEGEIALPKLMNHLNKRRFESARIPGVYSRRDLAYTGPAESVRSLDDLPHVSFRQYAENHGNDDIASSLGLRIPFETSRGCWWGEKHHCIFCGLNGSQMTFRRKSNERIRLELANLSLTFPDAEFAATDNILDLDILRSGALDSFSGRSIYFEVKANLKRSDVAELRSRRIMRVQLGIESLSTVCLKALDKGTSGLKNVEALKWCKEYGISVDWNLLIEIPKTERVDFLAQVGLMPALHHLSPPHSLCSLRIDRFSPLFDQPERFGLRNLVPSPAYEFVFDLPPDHLKGIAYFFTADEVPDPAESTYPVLQKALEIWQDEHESSFLFSVDLQGITWVFDSRAAGVVKMIRVEGLERDVLDASQKTINISRCLDLAQQEKVNEAIDSLLENKFLVREGDHIVSVVIPAGTHYPGADMLDALMVHMAEHARTQIREKRNE
ncbi:hypothetical protein DN412_29135 [Cupriavidus lacunae]|uniref:B12-binding domain-containing protein n=2 Tax=Cupriavidus lacunae TaxID=2666307 RepID=A0A370NML5_9BURK|nr:hypothetical protein DN412_29135 [Cupriavidus lacunae]